MTIREIELQEVTAALFAAFERRQEVTHCWRKEEGRWLVKPIAFVDDWTDEEYEELCACLRRTLHQGGTVLGAFDGEGALKGFASVEGERIGTHGQYADLSCLHVSRECRGKGTGRQLFAQACSYARALGAQKLYISAHSAVETQAFYRAMGCVEAEEYIQEHVLREPCDCQMECPL